MTFDDNKRYALIGNPNAGKTTLFNELTGASQHVGNWPGVTVAKKTGRLRPAFGGGADIIDLPGIYSLSPHSVEEKVSRNYIIQDKPDVVINIVEATNIERNLFLTCQVAELGVPMVVALNMMDEAAKAGDKIDVQGLSQRLGLPVVPITAVFGQGMEELIHAIDDLVELLKTVDEEASGHPHHGEDEHGHGIHDTEDPEEHIRDHHSDELGRTNALIAQHRYHNHYRGPKVIQAPADKHLSEQDETSNAESRYQFITDVVQATVRKGRKQEEFTSSDKIDRVTTNPILGIPIFLAVMWFMFHCVFSDNFLWLGIPSPGVWLQGLAQALVELVSSGLSGILPEGSWFTSLVVDGIIGGVGAVLSFLPQILILFFFLTLLEDIGYMSRAAFVMDRLLRKFGLSGKSFLPMLMGFGCSVPALMACRTVGDENDRKLTLFLVPFMSCGARAPIFLVFAGSFFASTADIMVFGLYLLGIIIAVLTGLLLKRLVFKGETAPLIIELSHYRAPRAKSLGLALAKTMQDYVQRAGTIIFLMTMVIWLLSSFGPPFKMVDIDQSYLAIIGQFISPLFVPLGFGFWAAAVAIITGFFAKEAVIGTLGVLAGIGEDAAIEGGGLNAATLTVMGFSPLAAFSFMVFCLLYLPCMAAFATLKREYNSWKWAIAQGAYAVAVAWIAAFGVFQLGLLLGFG